MDLKSYLQPKSLPEREKFADLCGTSKGHLQNVVYGKTCAPALATAIELHSGGAVKRQDMRPNDYWCIWPDLPAPKGAPKVRARRTARA